MLALAAYNGGLTNVDRWVAHAREHGGRLTIDEIPFPETREYVQRVLDAQQVYRTTTPASSGSSSDCPPPRRAPCAQRLP